MIGDRDDYSKYLCIRVLKFLEMSLAPSTFVQIRARIFAGRSGILSTAIRGVFAGSQRQMRLSLSGSDPPSCCKDNDSFIPSLEQKQFMSDSRNHKAFCSKELYKNITTARTSRQRKAFHCRGHRFRRVAPESGSSCRDLGYRSVRSGCSSSCRPWSSPGESRFRQGTRTNRRVPARTMPWPTERPCRRGLSRARTRPSERRRTA